MAHGKQKKEGLPPDKRPLFGPWNSVHRTKKDKENTRQNLKKKMREEVRELEQ